MKYITLLITCLLLSFNFSHAQEEIDPQLIKSIYFGGGSYYIDYQQVEELYQWLDSFEGIEQYDIIIHSHTDNIGSLEYNKWLSQMRSEATLQKLLQKGIPHSNLSIHDFGEENPIFDNATWQGKLSNRRVDVILRPPST